MREQMQTRRGHKRLYLTVALLVLVGMAACSRSPTSLVQPTTDETRGSGRLPSIQVKPMSIALVS